jgi:hypothetical protein
MKFKSPLALQFIKILKIDDRKYYAVSGSAVKGFNFTGYFELYDYKTQKLLYRNNSVCNVPYLYVNKLNEGVLDVMLISRDGRYKKNTDTLYLKLKLKQVN